MTPLAELIEEWELTPEGEPMRGRTAVVHPVRTAGGRPAVLKLVEPHPEAAHEALALQRWGGRGAVRLLRADPHRWALLLERLATEDLSQEWDVYACEVVARLYGSLHVPAPPQIQTLGEYVDQELSLPMTHLPRRLVDRARALARELRGVGEARLLHTDLHYANVLFDGAGGRGWVAIDPKPLAGDPHYELAPLLWNRFDELAGRVRDGVRDRFFALVDTAGLDEDRARDWVIVRAVLLAADLPELATVAISIAKAVT